MKVALIKYRDPMLFNKPDDSFYEEDIESFWPGIIRDAGIVVFEDADRLILGEAHIAEDNPELDNWDVRHPYYRCVRVIHKSQIIDRRDLNWDGKTDG